MDPSLAHLVSWSEQTKGEVPPPLTGPSITVSPLTSQPPTIFLFGGKYVHTRRLTSEMWAMDLQTRVWQRLDAGDGPGPRYFHSMDTWGDKLVCFGGMSESDPMSVYDDIWFFDCAARRWLPRSIAPDQDPKLMPAARYAHLSAVSRGKLVILGGQHADNSWIYEINVYDLRRRMWISRTEQPEMQGLHSKGAYRSVAASAKQRVISPPRIDSKAPSTTHSYRIDEDGEGGDIWCYSNYDFAKVRRELDVISPDAEFVPSPKHASPPFFGIRDDSSKVAGPSQPPGLRFPNGGIVGNHFILCGLYLASSSAAFSIWALNLSTMTWKHLEPAVLSTGSWNRAVLWPERAKLFVFGNASYDLAADYGRRAVNLDHIAVVSLETYGIYRPPQLGIPAKVQELGLTMLDEKLASDFDVVCEDGRRVRCARVVLRDRWAWFAEQEAELGNRIGSAIPDAPTLDINDTLFGGLDPARLTPTCLNIPEPLPVCVALVQYFYTLSLSTPLQNRAPVLSALLFLAKQYRIDRLARLVVHALHERLDAANAVGVYEIATLAGEQCLQVRALNLIHSAKSSITPRSGRPGTGSAQTNDTPQAPPPSYAPPTAASDRPGSSDTSGAGVQGKGGNANSGVDADDGNLRRARADSITLPDEAALAVESLLAALEMRDDSPVFDEPIARPVERLEPAEDTSYPRATAKTTSIPASSSSPPRLTSAQGGQKLPRGPIAAPAPALAPTRHHEPPNSHPPTRRLPRAPHTPEMPSPGNASSPGSTESDHASPLPKTPLYPEIEAFQFPSSVPMHSRSNSSSGGFVGKPLHTLPELDAIDDTSGARVRICAATLAAAGLAKAAPPPSYGSRQAAVIKSIAEQAQAQTQPQKSDPGHAHCCSATDDETHASPISNVGEGQTHAKTFDLSCTVTTRSASSSSLSTLADPAWRHYSLTSQTSHGSAMSLQKDLNALVTGTPISAEFDIHLSSPIMRTNTRTTTSGVSTSSGSTGGSSRQQEKQEKKMLAAAEKAAKKAESQARCEALRAAQQRKMAVSRAEAQRKAEIARQAEPAPKVVPTTKVGKFGLKFADAVLFPSGGKNSTMF